MVRLECLARQHGCSVSQMASAYVEGALLVGAKVGKRDSRMRSKDAAPEVEGARGTHVGLQQLMHRKVSDLSLILTALLLTSDAFFAHFYCPLKSQPWV